MKKYFLIISVLVSSILNAQKLNGTIYFKDGTIKNGLIKITNNEKIKFKTNKDSEDITTYSSIEVDKVEIEFEKNRKEIRVYKDIENLFQYGEKLLTLLVEGKVNLYIDMLHVDNGVQLVYYVDKKKEKLTKIYPVGFLGNGSDKAISEYFNDCPALIELLEREAFRKFVRMKKGLKSQYRLEEIVKYYNRECDN